MQNSGIAEKKMQNSAITGRKLPSWTPPTKLNKYLTGLMVNNSMTGDKTEFIPLEGRKVLWYGCGPTVYDAAHMGHARTYISFDIIRRIMTDYFGYAVTMCMNITDIDDKIIERSQTKQVDFAQFARQWENEFWKDMKQLNVLLPDMITRVSEFMPQVVSCVEQIIANGYGYESDGSVYFDTQAFMANDTHYYGRMEPNSVSDQQRALEGEGVLGIISDKKCPTDFALWKKAKEGEPFWESPWGLGRPGWHIECSAMATTMLGFPIDIHSGGIDLRFPHHDNELAQCESLYDRPQWVNYFLHTGHLHILGHKMSKSLKNFITISEALAEFPARCIRLLTLMHRWDAPMDYSPSGESMRGASAVDKQFVNFFALAKAKLRMTTLNICQKWRKEEKSLHTALKTAETEVHSALLDNFNTPTAVTALQALVTQCNGYFNSEAIEDLRLPVVLLCARFVMRILRIFGVTNGTEDDLNYTATTSVINSEGDESGMEGVCLAPLLDSLTKFRQDVRVSSQALLKAANDGGSKSENSKFVDTAMDTASQLLAKCDTLRDEDLAELGIQLEDKGSDCMWKLVPKEELLAERRRKVAEEESRLQKKREQQKKEDERKAKKEAELAVSPEQYYQTFQSEVYSKIDKEGIPTHLASGEAVSKSQKDKMRKFLEKHRQAHQKWKSST